MDGTLSHPTCGLTVYSDHYNRVPAHVYNWYRRCENQFSTTYGTLHPCTTVAQVYTHTLLMNILRYSLTYTSRTLHLLALYNVFLQVGFGPLRVALSVLIRQMFATDVDTSTQTLTTSSGRALPTPYSQAILLSALPSIS